jgi:2-polyprenyl-6-hydroxyphenyl methylase/3-demethylubiquinone-9 3-methyltransferase
MSTNVDQQELDKFNALAHRWWDAGGEFAPLHAINPLRLGWIDDRCGVAGRRIVDVGCGGGILTEAMALAGAHVKGIDLSPKALMVAQLHRLESGVAVDYEAVSAEALASREPAAYDLVTCLEMLEHVPDPASTVSACAALAAPGGHVFFSTISRNAKAYAYAVVGAEYLLNLLPKGTHDYGKFIRPSELARLCRQAGLEVRDITGLGYNALTKTYSLGPDTSVNYLMHAVRPS